MFQRYPRKSGAFQRIENSELRAKIDGFARLDNRSDLVGLLQLSPNTASSLNDNQLILLAYEKWGTGTPEYLLGDFAFTVYDQQNGCVFTARDHLGITPCYYVLNSFFYACSTAIEPLVSSGCAKSAVCEEAVAHYLQFGELRDARLTFFEDVKKLPPAHALLISGEDCREWAYWRPEDAPAVRFPTIQGYVGQLMSLLRESVCCRVTGEEVIGVHLSGGLDSSSIAALASLYAQDCGSKLYGYSWLSLFDREAKEEQSEWSPGEAVSKRYRIPVHYSDFKSAYLLNMLENVNIASGDTVDLWYEYLTRESARRDGVRVLLSGWGGDEFITHYGNQRYLETFLRGDIIATLRDLWNTATPGSSRLFSFTSLVYRELLRPWLPWRPDNTPPQMDCLSAARPEFAEYARALPGNQSSQPKRSVRQSQLAFLEQGHLTARLESWAVSGRRQGIEYRYPLLDKRLVEFALGLPPEMYRHRGHPRYLFRQAMRDLLPEEVWGRIRKEEPVRVQEALRICVEALTAWREQCIHHYKDNRFIDLQQLDALLEKISDGGPDMDWDRLLEIKTAIRSILVLNLSLDASRL